ncbi:MAG: cupin domain-containing protein [Acidimicrobiales bacterium]
MTEVASQPIDVAAKAWREAAPGVQMKHLWADKATGRSAALVRIEGGAELPRHRHDGDEVVFVLEGAFGDEFGELTAGNVGYRPNGCVHRVASANGVTALAILTGGVAGVAADAEAADAPASQIVTVNDIAWRDALPGVRQKPIWEDKAAGRRVLLTRFAPSAALPKHRHAGDELIFVLEGTSEDESGVIRAGDMSYRPNGCVHTVRSANGATVLAAVWGGIEPL